MGNESVLCPVCQGVLPADGREAYTPLRGRLILTNGYCPGGCADRRAAHVEQVRQRAPQAPQALPQSMVPSMGQGVSQPVAGPGGELPVRRPQAAVVGPGVRVPR
ncbi:hypothetical protein GCM10023096_67140 [Nonomuraea ferruginea]